MEKCFVFFSDLQAAKPGTDKIGNKDVPVTAYFQQEWEACVGTDIEHICPLPLLTTLFCHSLAERRIAIDQNTAPTQVQLMHLS